LFYCLKKDFGDFDKIQDEEEGKKSTAETAKTQNDPTRSKAKPKMYSNL